MKRLIACGYAAMLVEVFVVLQIALLSYCCTELVLYIADVLQRWYCTELVLYRTGVVQYWCCTVLVLYSVYIFAMASTLVGHGFHATH